MLVRQCFRLSQFHCLSALSQGLVEKSQPLSVLVASFFLLHHPPLICVSGSAAHTKKEMRASAMSCVCVKIDDERRRGRGALSASHQPDVQCGSGGLACLHLAMDLDHGGFLRRQEALFCVGHTCATLILISSSNNVFPPRSIGSSHCVGLGPPCRTSGTTQPGVFEL